MESPHDLLVVGESTFNWRITTPRRRLHVVSRYLLINLTVGSGSGLRVFLDGIESLPMFTY